MIARGFFILFLGISWTFSIMAANAAYLIDENKLSADRRASYLQVRNSLDSRTGGVARLQPASEAADAFMKENPDFLPIYVEKARALIMIGYYVDDFAAYNRRALQLMLDLQRKAPGYAKPYVLAGHIYTNLQDFKNAAKALQQAEQLKSADPWLYLNWSELYGQTRQLDKAVAMANKGLAASGENVKALVSAISAITRFSRNLDTQATVNQITNLVFETLKDPLKRLEVADWLVDSYEGRSTDLAIAHAIISRQRGETPDRIEVNLSMAELMLGIGFRVARNEIHQYDPHYASAADQLLKSVPWTESTKERIFKDRLAIALSDNDPLRAEDLIRQATERGIASNQIQASRAKILWLQRDYAGVVEIFEALAKNDPTYSSESMLAAAYLRTGKVQRFLELRKAEVEREPASAWANGNYAQTLLLVADDVDGAIRYGEKALELMPYKMARNITALAYLVRASIYKEAGNALKSQEYLRRAESLKFDEDYVDRNCRSHCQRIQSLRSARAQGANRL